MKGYTSLLILKRIFRTIKILGDLEAEPKPCDIFDLIVGTSTGGLIATMLGRLRMDIDDCLRYYEKIGSAVFGKKPPAGGLGRLCKILMGSPFYSITTLQDQIRLVLDDRRVYQNELFKESKVPKCKV